MEGKTSKEIIISQCGVYSVGEVSAMGKERARVLWDTRRGSGQRGFRGDASQLRGGAHQLWGRQAWV